MEIVIDRGIFSDAVLSTVAYWLSGNYTVERELQNSSELWKISRSDGAAFDEDRLKSDIFRSLNDQKLRQIIKDETKDIRTILYAKAFADCEELSEEDLAS
jgi:His-Xaa-Ser system protein HxsD